MGINKIIIVGGGSAGWMTAATLIKVFPEKDITLIESPNIATVGVGESTLGQIRQWCALIGLNDREFIPYTDASIKMSIKFTNFSKIGEAFHYPFGVPNLNNNYAEMNDWWFKKIANPKLSCSDFADSMYPIMALVNQNKCTEERIEGIDYIYDRDTAFHFDATKFGLWLKDRICIPNGVKHIKEEIKAINLNEDGIANLNNKYKADLFIDCTGFKAQLMNKMNVPFESLNDLLPNDSAWATRIPYKNKKKELVPYTNCTAYNNGWIWNIPLWSRIGTGYVYSSKFVSDEDALKEFKKYLKVKDGDFKNIKMRVGIHERLWLKNVCAIGLSAGFIEPLESNGLFSVHEFLYFLCRTLKRGYVNQYDKDGFTTACKNKFYNFATFVALHYALSQRTDTPYWKHIFNKTWDEKLYKLNPTLTNTLHRVVYDKFHNFRFEPGLGIAAICAGNNYAPADIVSLQYENHLKEVEMLKSAYTEMGNKLDKKKEHWNKLVKDAPSLYNFLKKIHD